MKHPVSLPACRRIADPSSLHPALAHTTALRCPQTLPKKWESFWQTHLTPVTVTCQPSTLIARKHLQYKRKGVSLWKGRKRREELCQSFPLLQHVLTTSSTASATPAPAHLGAPASLGFPSKSHSFTTDFLPQLEPSPSKALILLHPSVRAGEKLACLFLQWNNFNLLPFPCTGWIVSLEWKMLLLWSL